MISPHSPKQLTKTADNVVQYLGVSASVKYKGEVRCSNGSLEPTYSTLILKHDTTDQPNNMVLFPTACLSVINSFHTSLGQENISFSVSFKIT